MEITVEIPNLKQLRRAFSDYPEISGIYLREAGMESAFKIEREAKILSPVDTGRMRGSIGTSLGIADKGLTSIVQTNVNYAIYVHEGTARMRGRPFMRQGVEKSRGQIEEFYKRALIDTMDRIRKMSL